MTLLIAWIIFFLFAYLLFRWINRRTIRKNPVKINEPMTIPGTFYFEESQTVNMGEVTFHPEKFITIKTNNASDLKINGGNIRQLSFPLTGSLATSYLLIRTKNQKSILFFNGVNEEQLRSKLGVTQVDTVLGSSALAGGVMASKGGKNNPYTTSDEHTPIHVWLTKNAFPGYRSTLVKSDWLGFIFILMLPALIFIGVTIESLTTLLFDSQEAGAALMGWLVIIFAAAVSIFRIIQTMKLRRLLNNAKTSLR